MDMEKIIDTRIDEEEKEAMMYRGSAEKDKARRKRIRDHMARIRKDRVAKWDLYPGPYYSEEKRRVINRGRGKASAYLKKQASRRARHANMDVAREHAAYKRTFDYWWELT